MAIDLSKVTSASFLPGMLNSGTISGTALVSGTIPNTGNLVGSFNIALPDTRVISTLRVSLPDAHGDLTSWFPVMGTAELSDLTDNYRLVLYIGSSATGRKVYFNFFKLDTGSKVLSNFRIQFYGHLYSYPWHQA